MTPNQFYGVHKNPDVEKQEIKSIKDFFKSIHTMLNENHERCRKEKNNKSNKQQKPYLYGHDKFVNLSKRKKLQIYIQCLKSIEQEYRRMVIKIMQEFCHSTIREEDFSRHCCWHHKDKEIVELLLQRPGTIIWSNRYDTRARTQSPSLIQFQNEMIVSYKMDENL